VKGVAAVLLIALAAGISEAAVFKIVRAARVR
jgi:hypothetical protein